MWLAGTASFRRCLENVYVQIARTQQLLSYICLCTFVRYFRSENIIYKYVSLEQTWSRVTDVCIAYQSTVPFIVANCCSGIIKHDRARILS